MHGLPEDVPMRPKTPLIWHLARRGGALSEETDVMHHPSSVIIHRPFSIIHHPPITPPSALPGRLTTRLHLRYQYSPPPHSPPPTSVMNSFILL